LRSPACKAAAASGISRTSGEVRAVTRLRESPVDRGSQRGRPGWKDWAAGESGRSRGARRLNMTINDHGRPLIHRAIAKFGVFILASALPLRASVAVTRKPPGTRSWFVLVGFAFGPPQAGAGSLTQALLLASRAALRPAVGHRLRGPYTAGR